VAPEKIGPQGARLRCSRCKTVFRVQAAPEALAAPSTAPAAARTHALVAEADSETAKRIVEFLSRWGIAAEVVHDGGEALLNLHRKRPQLAILGGHLPGVSAPVVAEIVRRNAELRTVRLIRVAPIDEPAGAPEFDADHALEPADLPDGLGASLERLGLGKRPAPPPPAPKPAPAASPTARTPQPTRPTPAASSDSELAAAERLTRIIVSDIILYDDEKFVRAIREGNVLDAFEAELNEAKALFQKRVPEAIRGKRDFLAEELESRAERRRQTL
jgi:ActR/RegA family two-component response regulator